MENEQNINEAHVQAIYVGRLQRLMRLRREYREDLNSLGLRLLDNAVRATAMDILDRRTNLDTPLVQAGIKPLLTLFRRDFKHVISESDAKRLEAVLGPDIPEEEPPKQ